MVVTLKVVILKLIYNKSLIQKFLITLKKRLKVVKLIKSKFAQSIRQNQKSIL